jgi:hypothetical protein
LTKNGEDTKRESAGTRRGMDACPHCGHELSPWQQVLLTVDRALVCKNCWYRIILDISENQETAPPPEDKE